MMTPKTLLTIGFLLFFSKVLLAQKGGSSLPQGNERKSVIRCGFNRADQWNTPEKKAWLAQWEQALKQQVQQQKQERVQNVVYTIPVIVHVIHNGEPIGTGANISAAQVYSQLEVLNEDFRALNSDLGKVRATFKSVIGDAMVQFAPALHDPSGKFLEEPGIHRYHGQKASWTSNAFDQEIKPITQYDPYRYANFWVASLSSSLLGYAQFPLDPVVPGLPAGNESQVPTDGIVTDYRSFGSIAKVVTSQLASGEPYNLGRTATHEVGHWLGLFHVWGDGGCSEDDEVSDTPPQAQDSEGCPADNTASCNSLDMWENYMDYTDDACMHLFSKGQVARMQAVLELDNMRQQVINSDVLVLGKSYITSNITRTCVGGGVDFAVSLAENATFLGWKFDGGNPASATSPEAKTLYSQAGNFDVSIYVQQANGKVDTIVSKQYMRVSDPAVAQKIPIQEGFEQGVPISWRYLQSPVWKSANLGNASANALLLDNYNIDYKNRAQMLFSPIIDLREEKGGLVIAFDRAYAYFSAAGKNTFDSLAVGYINPCNGKTEWLWAASGASLATAPPTSETYIPKANDWQRQQLYISNAAALDYIQLVFAGVGNYGNNLYIDNISVDRVAGASPNMHLAFREVCLGQALEITNTTAFFGEPNAIAWEWQVAGAVPEFSGEFEPSNFTFNKAGTYNIRLSAIIDGVYYTQQFDSAVQVVDLPQVATMVAEKIIDSVQLFKNRSWQFAPSGAWEAKSKYKEAQDQSLFVDYFHKKYDQANPVSLTTPVFPFKGNANAFIAFDWAHAGRTAPDRTRGLYNDLAVLYSTDCGATFQLLKLIRGMDEAIAPAMDIAFIPSKEEWQTTRIPMYGLNANGDFESIRFAIQVVDQGGNNVWIDNLVAGTFPSASPEADFYTTAYPQPEDLGTIYVNEPVTFKSTAQHFPQFFTWALPGAVESYSNALSPTVVYANPGIYSATLMVSSPYGQDITTKSDYINVVYPEVGSSKTMRQTSGVEVFDRSDFYGYISGHNEYKDSTIAMYFEEQFPYSLLESIDVGFLEAKSSDTDMPVRVSVWNAKDGKPDKVIASYELSMQEAMQSANEGTLARVQLTSPLSIQGDFFIGLSLRDLQPSDTLALRMDRTVSNRAWRHQAFGDWFAFSDPTPDGWGVARSLWIFPTLSVPEVIVTSVEDEALAKQLSIYPNPSQNGLFYLATEDLQLISAQVLNLLGQSLFVLRRPQDQIDLSLLPNGMYLLLFETTQGRVLKKVMIGK